MTDADEAVRTAEQVWDEFEDCLRRDDELKVLRRALAAAAWQALEEAVDAVWKGSTRDLKALRDAARRRYQELAK